MRLYIKLSPNTQVIPFNYQHLLTGVVHKWIGRGNQEHGSRSLYTFSWLQNTRKVDNGFDLNPGAYFFISAYESDLIKKIVRGILAAPEMFCGSRALDVQLKEVPEFSGEERFFLSSPVLIRQKDGDKTRHVTFRDADFESILTENLKSKLRQVNLFNEDVSVELDKTYTSPKTKLVTYKGIDNKTTFAPIIIKGTPEQIAFAWAVGLGNSTGIGFGALK